MTAMTSTEESVRHRIAHLEITPAEAGIVRAQARELHGTTAGELDDVGFLAGARDRWERLPLAVRQFVRRFRRDPGSAGVFVIDGMPLDAELGPTPVRHGSVQRQATIASSGLVLVALGLGEPLAYSQEKSGALVQDVIPVPDFAESQSNAGSVELEFHTENAFHPHRPDYVMLMCLRPDPVGVAKLRTAGIRRALPLLSDHDRDLLFRPWYITEAPPSFGGTQRETAPAPVLSGAAEDPDVRVDFHATRAVREEGAEALIRLRAALDAAAIEIPLRPGQLAVVDNRLAVHGRSAFTPAYDGRDRWLQRMYVHADLRCSRLGRPGDGHVVTDAARS